MSSDNLYYIFLLQTCFMAIFLILPFSSLPCGSSYSGQNIALNISTKTYNINLPSSRHCYELQVKSTIVDYCGESCFWSDWSPPVFWGSMRESAQNSTGKNNSNTHSNTNLIYGEQERDREGERENHWAPCGFLVD